MGMKLASKLIGGLVVNSQLFKLVKGVLSVAGPTNTQRDGVESHSFCTNEFAEVCMLPLCRLQLLFRPRVLTALDFNQVHMSMVSIQLVRLSHAVSYAGPQWGAVPAAKHMVLARERRSSGVLKVVLCQPIITSNVRVNRAAPKGLLLRALLIILPATLWYSVFMLEMIRFGSLGACGVRCLIDDSLGAGIMEGVSGILNDGVLHG
eukprot:445705-Pelagomonas_calceolata.AAC.1